MERIYVLYHGNCFDGMGAYYAAWKKFGSNATYIAVNYGDPTPEMEPKSIVYILDFSYSKIITEILATVHKEVIVLDHHKTAEAELKDINLPNVEVIFDMDRSGAVITWEYFHPLDCVPELLLNIQDRDLWKFKLPNSKIICAALRIFAFDIDIWDGLINLRQRDRINLEEKGRTIISYENTLIDKFCQEVMTGTIGGYKVPIINISTAFSEATAALLNKHPEAAFAAYFYVRSGGTVHFGLRSKGDFDVSEICKQYGGGGHKNASGFVAGLKALDRILF